MTKAERKKIAMRNLRKAWAARKRKKTSVRKQTRRRKKTTITGIAGYCEKYGLGYVLSQASKWSVLNARELNASKSYNDSKAYGTFANLTAQLAARAKYRGV